MIHTKKRPRNDPPPRGYYLPPEPEPAPGPSWDDLVQAAPALARFEQEAAQLAGSTLPFIRWQLWLRDFGEFRGLIHDAGRSAGILFGDALNLAFDHLAAVYQRAARTASGRR